MERFGIPARLQNKYVNSPLYETIAGEFLLASETTGYAGGGIP